MLPEVELRRCWKRAIDEEVGGLEERRTFGQLLDWVASAKVPNSVWSPQTEMWAPTYSEGLWKLVQEMYSNVREMLTAGFAVDVGDS
jgi:hypothetical protein